MHIASARPGLREGDGRADGALVAMYYWATDERPQQHIAATIIDTAKSVVPVKSAKRVVVHGGPEIFCAWPANNGLWTWGSEMLVGFSKRKFAEKEGHVTTLLDRIRYFPELKGGDRMARQQALRAAVNTTIQGTAADLIKKAMLDIDARLARGRLAARMIIQVHDELVLEVPGPEIEKVASLVREAMEGVHPLNVPLTIDLGWGPNWLDAKAS